MVEFTQHQARLLTEARLGHLSTADSQGVPHVIPLCYAFDGRVIYSVLDQKPKRTALVELKRVRNIQSNPRVALVVDHYSEDWQNLWYLLVHGDALVLEPGREQAAAVGLLRQKYRQYQGMDIDRNPVIKIIPHRVVSWSGATGRV
jgi:PPOX class probable F420-dependent enzyme